MIGVARELAALYGKELRIPEIQSDRIHQRKPRSFPASPLKTLTCVRAISAGCSIRSKIGPSPAWMCQRLIAAGQRHHQQCRRYYELCAPRNRPSLHAFDYDKLAENRVVVRRALEGEVMTTLDDEKRALDTDMLVIADARQAQAVAGVMAAPTAKWGRAAPGFSSKAPIFSRLPCARPRAPSALFLKLPSISSAARTRKWRSMPLTAAPS